MNVQTAAKHAISPVTPELPQARPETLGLSSNRLQTMSDAFKREIDKGTTPGVTMLVSRRGQIGYFEAFGKLTPDGSAANSSRLMTRDSLFRIFSMTKPIVSLGIMQLVENGHILLNDPLAKYIPEFADTKVGVERNGALELALPLRPITIQDLLRHTSGISYEITGNGMVQRMYQKSNLRNRDITNEEHARIVAGLPLICQPGSEWNYSRSTDILGRVIEVVSGKSLGNYLTENILAPLQMAETGFHTASANKDRIAQPFPTDPWTGEKVALFDPLEIPKMESGGGGLVSKTMDYARFCQMLLNGGTLDGTRVIGSRTLHLMASNHLTPSVKLETHLVPPGHGFGLGFAVRTDDGLAPYAGSRGQFFWSGVAGTFFWIDPQEELFAVFMSQGPGQREYFRTLIRSLVYAAVE
ncbi:serine hydrolase domain-containing protein [Tardiphaga sp. P9-11]|uniref:serine hydrolase domain-containing protein n=1 Tax=Tardiphaga sp. P9-11 TaxID=2024614 RepID=UPI0011F350D0|nr:serine hydrolase domain-containing protein [Tardiphaga sp. P9-11]KAA0072605.1 class A beta-lactamase-related serine hydrolase [Tardiphaga sp. P9-11]